MILLLNAGQTVIAKRMALVTGYGWNRASLVDCQPAVKKLPRCLVNAFSHTRLKMMLAGLDRCRIDCDLAVAVVLAARIAYGDLALKTALAPVAQWIEHSFPKAGVAGSIPAGGACFTEVFDRFLLNNFPHFTCFWTNSSQNSDVSLTFSLASRCDTACRSNTLQSLVLPRFPRFPRHLLSGGKF